MSEFLPIGSIILLKNTSKNLMIYGRKMLHEESGEIFDYIGCPYPEGYLADEFSYLFNKEDIAQIVSPGYADEEEKNFVKEYLLDPPESSAFV